ncbi:MAG: PAS domain S-box protein [Bacteroidales bacterium]|nr:PAS domain S-box protein [Bacteroidales bacterium]
MLKIKDKLKIQEILLNNVTEILSIYDENMSLKYISPSITKILGYKPEEMMEGKNIERLSWKGEKAMRSMFDSLLLNPKQSFTIQHPYLKKNGEKVFLETTGRNLLDDPVIRGIMLNTVDISAQKQAEREGRLKHKMKSLSENSQDFIVRLSINETIYYANPIVKYFTGKDPRQLINNTIDEASMPQQIKHYFKETVKVIKIDPVNTSREMILQAEMNGSKGTKIMYFTAIPEFFENELESILFVGHDITEVRKISIELQEANKDLQMQKDKLQVTNKLLEKQRKELHESNELLKERKEELENQKQKLQNALKNLRLTQNQLIQSGKMASLGQLTAGIAHELNNPINFVSGNVSPLTRDIGEILGILNRYEEVIREKKLEESFGEIESLREKLDLDYLIGEVKDLLKGIGEGAHRSSEIIKGLRSFSRLDKDEFMLADIHEGLDTTLVLLNNKTKNRITVHKDYGDLPQIECLLSKLNQVFMNILTNSIEAIQDCGEIFIRTVSDRTYVKVNIRDTGIGMSPEVRERIFEPFYTTKDVGKGLGLGLSISYGIIEQHHGSIDVISKPGHGTEFIVSLPIIQPDNSPRNDN